MDTTPNTPAKSVEGTPTSSLDPSDEKARGLVRKAIAQRWPGLDEKARGEFVEGLKVANEAMQKGVKAANSVADAAAAARALASIVKTAAAMEQQQQADDHLADKNDRLDTGKLTDRVGMEPIVCCTPVPRPQ